MQSTEHRTSNNERSIIRFLHFLKRNNSKKNDHAVKVIVRKIDSILIHLVRVNLSCINSIRINKLEMMKSTIKYNLLIFIY